MEKNILTHAATIALFAVLAIPAQSFAQQPRYRLVDLGTLGGTQSYVNVGSGLDFGQHIAAVNRDGAVVGFADTSASDPFPNFCFWDCFVVNAFLSDRSGVLTNLGALPGGGSSVPTWITKNGLIAGLSENGETDPLYPGLPQLRAVLWKDGNIIDLKTLPEGGYQSEANAVNRFGQVVGAALNMVPDNNSMQGGTFWLWGGISPAYPYQTRAFIWEQENGMQDLGTLGGTDAQALLINDRGQVVGNSYINSTPSPVCLLTTGAFIWEKDRGMRDLGSFGGTCTLASDLNQRGQVVGSSDLKGDRGADAFLWDGALHHLGGSLGGTFGTGAFAVNQAGQAVGFGYVAGNLQYHATLWKQIGKITDLGVLGSDQCSYAADINAHGQIVGSSIPTCYSDPTSFRAFLWQDNSLFDLNTLIPPNSPLYLQYVQTINDRGEIVGQGVDESGNEHAFLLVPCNQNSSLDCGEGLADDASAAPAQEAAHAQPHPSSNSRAVHFMLRRKMPPLSRTLAPTSGFGDPNDGIRSDSSSQDGDLIEQRERATVAAGLRGYCSVENEKLTGRCYGEVTAFVCSSGESSRCPVGAKAIKPEGNQCGLFGRATVDVARACSF